MNDISKSSNNNEDDDDEDEAKSRLIMGDGHCEADGDDDEGRLIKTKPCKRRPVGMNGRAQVRISRLVDSFSEYLSGRNVVSGPNHPDDELHCLPPTIGRAEEQTTKATKQPPPRKLNFISDLRTNFDEFQAYSSGERHHQKQQQPAKWNPQSKVNTTNGQDGCYNESSCCWLVSRAPKAVFGGDWPSTSSSSSPSSRTRRKATRQLLAALLRGSNDLSRLDLVLRLLRAPIVLAAMFSLVLAASLLVLYALSFHNHRLPSRHYLHHNNSMDSNDNQIAELLEGLQEDLTNNIETTGDNRKTTNMRQQHHYINSRDLQRDEAAGLRVRAGCTTYVGVPEGGAVAFKGIAYARPPTGVRRWARPQPIWLDDQEDCLGRGEEARNETREVSASQFGSHCVQVSPFTRQVSGREDCLYLDIFVPMRRNATEKTARPIPVMVYIHGGFLAYGSSGQGEVNWMRSRPSGQLAAELDVVLVAVNYRLQALGFMALEQLAESNNQSAGQADEDDHQDQQNKPGLARGASEGNYGLWDQLVALNWIKRNIESFGGQPRNIVLFGPDSASALPLALMSRTTRTPAETTTTITGRPEARGHHKQSASNESHGRPGSSWNWRQKDHVEQLMDRNLFRAVWLTNPTVYYELAPALANKHYERLIESQSICSTAATAAASASAAATTTTTGQRMARQATTTINNHTTTDGDSLSGGGGGGQTNHRARHETLRECLMNLEAEQVAREYLGRDDPAFRLDDQSSLPIKNIFPDQFVTVDGLLVQDSFPFKSTPTTPTTANNIHENHHSLINANDSMNGRAKAIINDSSSSASSPSSSYSKRVLLGSSTQAVEYWPCPRDLYHWNWEDFRRYVGTSLNSFTQETYRRASELYQVPSESTSATNTTTTKSPIETYLSMVSDIKQICPINELAESLRRTGNPPNDINEVQRYIVEWRPSNQLSASLNQPGNNCGVAAETVAPAEVISNTQHQQTNTPPQQQQHKPRFAFHYWDLMAFFGFEFEPNAQPNEMDLKFQRQIRAMVKEFAWARNYDDEQPKKQQQEQQPQPRNDLNGQASESDSSGSHDDQRQNMISDGQTRGGGHDEDVNGGHDGFILFALDGTKRRVEEFRRNECEMWSKFLKQSYAWIS